MIQHILHDQERKQINGMLIFLYSLLLYLPATAVLPATTYYIISIYVFFYRIFFGGFNKEFCSIAVFLLLSLLISSLSSFFVSNDLNYHNNFIPLQLSLLCSLVIATSLTRKVAFYIICFILLECVSGYIQLFLGLKTFFPFVPVAIPEMGDPNGLLYYMRVYGLSENSSGFAGNVIILISLFSLYFYGQTRKIKNIVFSLSLLALVVCFSRSGMLAFLVLFFVVLARDFKINHLKVLLPFFLVCLVVSYYIVDWEAVFSQLSRGRQSVDISGRDLIWFSYFHEINNSPIFGNHSLREFLSVPVYGVMHAHNSYIMLLYILGVVPLFLMMLPMFFLMLRKPAFFIFLSGLLTYSLAQYFLFWGASLADIVFFSAFVSPCFSNSVGNLNSLVKEPVGM